MLKTPDKFSPSFLNRTILRNLILLIAMSGVLIIIRSVSGQVGFITELSGIPANTESVSPEHAILHGIAECDEGESIIYAEADVCYICANGNSVWNAAHLEGSVGGKQVTGRGESYEFYHGRQVFAGGQVKNCYLPPVPWNFSWPERCSYDNIDPGTGGGSGSGGGGGGGGDGGGGGGGTVGGGTNNDGLTYYYEICTQVCSIVCEPDMETNSGCMPGTQSEECAPADCRVECFGDC